MKEYKTLALIGSDDEFRYACFPYFSENLVERNLMKVEAKHHGYVWEPTLTNLGYWHTEVAGDIGLFYPTDYKNWTEHFICLSNSYMRIIYCREGIWEGGKWES